MLSLSQANISVILLSVAVTLLLLRNNHIPLYQFSNFVQLLSNCSGSRTILFSITACAVSLYTAGIGAVNISSNVGSIVLLLSEVYSLIILNDSNISLSVLISIASYLYLSILFVCSFYHNIILLLFQWSNHNKALNIRSVVVYKLLAWDYKANPNSNPSKETTVANIPCPYIFKYLNCKNDYVTNCQSCKHWTLFYFFIFISLLWTQAYMMVT